MVVKQLVEHVSFRCLRQLNVSCVGEMHTNHSCSQLMAHCNDGSYADPFDNCSNIDFYVHWVSSKIWRVVKIPSVEGRWRINEWNMMQNDAELMNHRWIIRVGILEGRWPWITFCKMFPSDAIDNWMCHVYFPSFLNFLGLPKFFQGVFNLRDSSARVGGRSESKSIWAAAI